METVVRAERPGDRPGMEEVHQRAFGRVDEAQLVAALIDGGYGRVSLVAEQAGRIVGHVLFTELPIVDGGTAFLAISLAPLAVLPEYQRQGIGGRLVHAGLSACRAAGERAVVVLGHPHYYPRFGFSVALTSELQSVFKGEAFMALELVPGALAGMRGEVRYPPPFGV